MGIFDRFTQRWTVSAAGGDDRLPAGVAERLADVGRHAAGGRPDRASESVLSEWLEADPEPDEFVDALVSLALRRGGWEAFGAQRWLRDVAPASMRRAGATRMADVGVAWVVAQGYGSALDPWERQRAPGDAQL